MTSFCGNFFVVSREKRGSAVRWRIYELHLLGENPCWLLFPHHVTAEAKPILFLPSIYLTPVPSYNFPAALCLWLLFTRFFGQWQLAVDVRTEMPRPLQLPSVASLFWYNFPAVFTLQETREFRVELAARGSDGKWENECRICSPPPPFSWYAFLC